MQQQTQVQVEQNKYTFDIYWCILFHAFSRILAWSDGLFVPFVLFLWICCFDVLCATLVWLWFSGLQSDASMFCLKTWLASSRVSCEVAAALGRLNFSHRFLVWMCLGTYVVFYYLRSLLSEVMSVGRQALARYNLYSWSMLSNQTTNVCLVWLQGAVIDAGDFPSYR